jgi:hypothetical protein
VQIRVEIGATVLNDGQAEICVACLKKSGEDNATCRDAEEDERVKIVGAENHGEVGTRESANTMLGDNDFIFDGSERRGDAAQGFLKQFLMLWRSLDCAE